MTIELTIFLIALMLTVALATFISIFSHHINQLKKKVKILENNHLSFMNEAFSKIAEERKERMKDRNRKLQRGGYAASRREYSRIAQVFIRIVIGKRVGPLRKVAHNEA